MDCTTPQIDSSLKAKPVSIETACAENKAPSRGVGLTRFQITGGTAIGREHARLRQNSQDALAWGRSEDLLFGVVADGCSSGRHNEVGAKLATRWMAHHLLETRRFEHKSWDRCAEMLFRGLRDYLRTVCTPLAAAQGLAQVVNDNFLFTILVVVMDPHDTAVFGIGDGVLRVNGANHQLGVSSDNAPDYVGYGLLDRFGDPKVQVHLSLPTDEVLELVLATDGVEPLLNRDERLLAPDGEGEGLGQFTEQSRNFRNHSLVSKRLAVLRSSRLGVGLHDDATLVAIGRVAP